MKAVMHILVIDDDEDDFFIIKDYCSEIKSATIKVDWVSTYAEGERAVVDCKYDIFFVDYLLGGKSGLEMVEFAVANNCPAPLVLLTGYADDDIDRRALRSGATDYLAKSDLSAPMLERTLRHSVERYEQRQLFHQQEAKFRGFFEQTQEGIFLVNEKWKAQDLNNSFTRLFELRAEDAAKELKSVIIPEQDRARFDALLEESGQVNNYPVTLRKESGGIELLVSCKKVHDINNGLMGYQGIVRDITTFKRAEKELASAERFNLSGRMARIIAHEVRNPLSNISLAAGYLDDIDGLDKETLVQYVDILKRNSSRISNLIDGLLQSTRSTELKMELFSSTKAIEQTMVVCGDRLKLKDVSVSVDHTSEPLEIHGDLEKVVIVMTNIITNAIEAMNEVSEPKLTIETLQTGEFTQIAISDNGKGMSEATKQKLFDPFFTERHGGMGLGLSSVKHLMDQHQGMIFVESELGEGTTFRLCFPGK